MIEQDAVHQTCFGCQKSFTPNRVVGPTAAMPAYAYSLLFCTPECHRRWREAKHCNYCGASEQHDKKLTVSDQMGVPVQWFCDLHHLQLYRADLAKGARNEEN